MNTTAPNRYFELSLGELANAVSNRAGELLKEVPAGRRDTAYLLIAAARKISPLTVHPNAPVKQVESGELAYAAFWPEYEAEARHSRYRIFVHAADALAFRCGLERIVPHARWDRLAELATESDERLRGAIQALDATAATLKT